MSWLVKVHVRFRGQPHFSATLDRSPITLGAEPRNDLVLSDRFVSGQHAVVTVLGGKLVYRDRSTNGSFFEGQRIEEKNLGHGGKISIPPFEVNFALDIAEEEWKTAYRGDLAPVMPAVKPAARDAEEKLEPPPVPTPEPPPVPEPETRQPDPTRKRWW